MNADQAPQCISIHDVTDLEGIEPYSYLSIEAGAPPTTETITRLGHEPNGYFWEGVVRWLQGKGTVTEVGEPDPEGGAYITRVALGGRAQLEALAAALAPYLIDDEAIAALITEADAAGFDFDD
ncbi:hypothetical protein [Actinomyces bowdenii]|uniref:Uncharacterized protein n=1 Tax=Actinomyces bowdenii TaxID=131109 RepID=A0A853EKH2_9ACTO|nr:hypothetical protein [Actinomyces bowdenii]MBF0696539.1 hypothetical protein [Actinomyces bowdenii]MDO5063722.1 hypothetical protein [Actinomyces bowdenii]NYS68712.1 hypothetical protein [Actinomyces bowdenii]